MNQPRQYSSARGLETGSRTHGGRPRILIEASKLADARMDGIKRYVLELLKGLRALPPTDYTVEVLIRQRIFDLEQLPEDLTTVSGMMAAAPNGGVEQSRAADSVSRVAAVARVRHQVLRHLGHWLPPIVVPIAGRLIPDGLSRALLGKPKAALVMPEALAPGSPPWAWLMPPVAVGSWYRVANSWRARWLRITTPPCSTLSTGPYDLVHLTLPNNFHYLGAHSRAPLLVTVHDLSHRICPKLQARENNVTLEVGLGRAVQVGARFLTVSEATRGDLLRIYGVEPEMVKTVLNGCERSVFHRVNEKPAQLEVGKRYGLPGGRFFLGLCTIEPRKNLVSTIRAFELLIKELDDQEVHLVLAGSQGWKVRKTIRLARRMDGRVHLTGYVADEDLAPLYSAATGFVFASHYEGFGFPLLEAMNCGVPVIYGDNSSMREIVGDAGLPADPSNPSQIMMHMRSLLRNPEWAEQLGEKGRLRAREFDWRRAVAATDAVYRGLLGIEHDAAAPKAGAA